MSLSEEQAKLIARVTLPTLRNEYEITQKVIKAVPEGSKDYRPQPFSASALDLTWHIAAAEHMFLHGVIAGKFEYPGSRPEDVTTPDQVADWHAHSFHEAMGKLKDLEGEQFLRVLDFRGVVQLPAFAYLTFAVNHTIHHRGQLSTYLRLMGARVPSIYGESYDDARDRAARNS